MNFPAVLIYLKDTPAVTSVKFLKQPYYREPVNVVSVRFLLTFKMVQHRLNKKYILQKY